MTVKGRTILVTGATSGIGAAVAATLANRGATVLVHGRTMEKAQAFASKYPSCIPIAADLARPDQVEGLLLQIEQEFPHLAGLVLNAGVQYNYEFLESEEVISRIAREVQTNTVAHMQISAALLPVLLQHDEAFIAGVTSLLALTPKRSAPVYSASKAAMRAFLKGLRYQLVDTSIHIAEWVPPLVDTAMTEGRAGRKMQPQDVARQFVESIEKGKERCAPGIGKVLPTILRFAPGLIERKFSMS